MAMPFVLTYLIAALVAGAPLPAPASQDAMIARQPIAIPLAPLARLVGYCWRGRLPETGVFDIHCYNARMDGRIISDRHVIADKPPFCGETLYHVEQIPGQRAVAIAFRYYSQSGLVSDGVVEVQGRDALRFPEETVQLDTGGEARFRSVLRFISPERYDLETWQQDGAVWRQIQAISYDREDGDVAPPQYQACR